MSYLPTTGRILAHAILAHAKRWARLTAYIGCVSLFVLAALARAVWGAVGDRALEVGSQLVALGDTLGPNYRVHLNGAEVNVASATTELGVSPVLDRFEEECREHAGALAQDFQKLSQALGSQTPPILKGAAGLGIIRKEKQGGGMVACLARDGARATLSLAEALHLFERTNDLSALGHLRYVTAEQRPSGKTHVVSIWTDGPIHVGEMFPGEGDAPGPDPGDPVRPPHARRLLSANVENAPFGVQVYASSDTADTVFAHYDRDMAASGWDRNLGSLDALRNERLYRRGGVDLMVLVKPDPGGRTTVSILSMPSR